MSKKLKNFDGKIAGLYDLEETLGRGHFAVVKLARHVFTGEKVAVKVIDKNKLDDTSKAHLFQEVRCMKLVQHPNVIRLYEVIDTQTKLYLILELGDGGDLYDYIMRHEGGLSEEVARIYFRQILKAISYCHRLHVVHRDLKPENVVFFEKSGTVKITDFGFSNRFCPGQKLDTSCGSLAYSAPEILLGDSYDAPAVDVWSLGVILYMLVCGQAPFQEANDSETLTMILDCKYSVPKRISNECKNLIAKMLTKEPDKRATLNDIAKDEWFIKDLDENVVENLPLVFRQQVSEENHNLIVNKMVNGNIATKEDIIEALEKNEYNHLTATYYLLAERKLRSEGQEAQSSTHEEARHFHSSEKCASNLDHSFLRVPYLSRNPTQIPRDRKCSIVLEEEDEDLSSGKDEHSHSSSVGVFHRRGSRSDGKISHIFQERLVEIPKQNCGSNNIRYAFEELSLKSKESPIYYKKKIYADLPDSFTDVSEASKKLNLRCRNREKNKIKSQKIKTKSCSSSDASDDDNENRKKRSIRANNIDNSVIKKKDSYDDSSDSQGPGCDSTKCRRTRNVKLMNKASSSKSNVSNVVDKTESSSNSDRKHSHIVKKISENEEQCLSEYSKLPRFKIIDTYFKVNQIYLKNGTILLCFY